MKTYRRHNCTRRHRTYRTLAGCIWKRATWINGEGPYALVARCDRGPTRRALTITLHATIEDAEASKALIDSTGCGGGCYRDHEIVKLEP